MEYKIECGCIVVESPPNFRIKYCPKHKSAPLLYETIQAAIVEIEDGSANHAHLILTEALRDV